MVEAFRHAPGSRVLSPRAPLLRQPGDERASVLVHLIQLIFQVPDVCRKAHAVPLRRSVESVIGAFTQQEPFTAENAEPQQYFLCALCALSGKSFFGLRRVTRESFL